MNKLLFTSFIISLLIILSSCASTTVDGDVADPLETLNRSIFKFNDTVDVYVAKPVAKTYQYIPSSIQTGVNNFFNNLDDVMTVLNDLLQLKIHQSLEDSMRIIANTTFGIAGFSDVATKWGLARHNERFADTLGYWGIGSGPYLVIPILGPSSIRDATALIGDIYSYPLAYLYPIAYRNSLQGLKMVNDRSRLLAVTDLTDDVAIDTYLFTRDAYYQWRQNQIYDGNPPDRFLHDFNPEDL